MNLIGKDTNKDAIMMYLKDPEGGMDNLTLKQRQLLDYYTDAYTLIRNYKSTPDAINVLVKLSIQRGEQISASTARRYIQDAQDIFGYASKVKGEAIRHLATEITRDAIAMARDQNNPDAMMKGAMNLVTINGEDEDAPFNAEMLEQHIIELHIDDEAKNLMRLMAAKGTVDLDELMGNVANSMADDAEIIPDDGGDS